MSQQYTGAPPGSNFPPRGNLPPYNYGPPQPGSMGPPQGCIGPSPPGGMRPPHANGPSGPPGPPGNYGPPVKPVMSQAGVQNGPTAGRMSGPMGDPYSHSNGYSQPGVSSGPMQQMSNQMGAMNISGPPPQKPMDMSGGKMPYQGGQIPPPSSSSSYPLGPPPISNTMNQPASTSTTNSYQGQYNQMPPPAGNFSHTANTGNVPSSQGNFPPSQHGNFPPVTDPGTFKPSGFHPPTSQPGGMPPNIYQPGGFPPASSQPGSFPPTSSQPGGFAPPPAGSLPGMMPPPPGSQPGSQNMMPPNITSPIQSSAYSQNYPGGPAGYTQSGPPLTPPGNLPHGYTQPGGFPAAPRAPTPSGPMSGPSQQPRKLDPDQMPSPIQVIEDDKRARGGVFQTSARGIAPPLVTTNFNVEDHGNSSPRFIRSTMYTIPVSSDMMNTSKIPFATTITPFARLPDSEAPPPMVDLGQLGPVRCNRCKAYMCPFMQFVDGGRRFQCAFCNCNTDVPAEYFAHLDHTGRRTDCYDRPELCLGTYEFVATTDYCKDNKLPKPPAFIFMIDVSYNSVKSGLVHLICDRLKNDVLYNLPKETGADESEIRVGFVTYHKELHFFNVKGSLAQPQMMVVSDIEDVFVPLLDGFLVKLSESEAVIDSLLAQIPELFNDSRETEIVLGPVIQAGLDALISAECVGKLFIFHSSLPVAQAPGVLKNRDDRKLLGTEKEKTILTPQSNFYTKLGQECVKAGCSVELFLFPNSYIDVATIAEVPRITGGGLHKYQYFQADLSGDQLIDDLKTLVEKPVAFDCIMRVRTSTGIRPVDFLGNFYMSNTTDVEIASIDCDKAVTVEIKHDDKLSEGEGAFLQCAVLYTSVGGQRRLRIINQSFTCCSQMADLFRNCELDALINYSAKHAIRSTLNSNPKQVREHLMNQCAQILACYRQKCASPSSAGQLILPECMKLLPLYSNCLIKSSALQGSADISTDDRSWLMFLVNAMPVKATQCYFYPRLIPVHNLDVDSENLPVAVRCSYERMQDTGAYIIENGLVMLMWVGFNINQKWVQDVFGVHSAAQIDIDRTRLEEFDNPRSKKLKNVIAKIRAERQKHLKLIIVRQRDKLEPVFQQYLVEDRGANGTASYVDFLCHIHKEIRNILN